MPMNLELHRSDDSIWDRTNRGVDRDGERWLLAVMGGAFIVMGLRRRSIGGLLMVAVGGALVWWTSSEAYERRLAHRRPRGAARMVADRIGEASEESFPASDAPAWTPTTGNTPTPLHVRWPTQTH